ncbi:MAG: hypothetical protein LUH00_09915 [Lachnospiraceae bacterium]|nr:hypothetical protein [Lachnospiraceae bacterium]
MLREYETDYETGMDTEAIAKMIYDYTSGYPFLVSRMCKLLDEQIVESEAFPDRKSAWTNERGEEQLAEYLDYYHLKKGYMLSFNFNKKKKIGVQEIFLEDKVLVEAVV